MGTLSVISIGLEFSLIIPATSTMSSDGCVRIQWKCVRTTGKRANRFRREHRVSIELHFDWKCVRCMWRVFQSVSSVLRWEREESRRASAHPRSSSDYYTPPVTVLDRERDFETYDILILVSFHKLGLSMFWRPWVTFKLDSNLWKTPEISMHCLASLEKRGTSRSTLFFGIFRGSEKTEWRSNRIAPKKIQLKASWNISNSPPILTIVRSKFRHRFSLQFK